MCRQIKKITEPVMSIPVNGTFDRKEEPKNRFKKYIYVSCDSVVNIK